MSKTQQIMEEVQRTDVTNLKPEDIIHNLQISLQELAKENGRLEDKIESLEADNAILRDAIVNSFTSDWATLGRQEARYGKD